MPGQLLRKVWRDLGYRSKFGHFGFLNIIIIVTIILSTRDTPAVKPEAFPQTASNEGTYFVLMAMVLYFLPSLVAWGKRNWAPIFLFNLLLGWTLIGWIVALLWGWMMEALRPKSAQANASDS